MPLIAIGETHRSADIAIVGLGSLGVDGESIGSLELHVKNSCTALSA
jgi:hypothetical protein